MCKKDITFKILNQAGNRSTNVPIANPNPSTGSGQVILWGAAAAATLGATLAEWQRRREEEEAARRASMFSGGGGDEEEEASDVSAKKRAKVMAKNQAKRAQEQAWENARTAQKTQQAQNAITKNNNLAQAEAEMGKVKPVTPYVASSYIDNDEEKRLKGQESQRAWTAGKTEEEKLKTYMDGFWDWVKSPSTWWNAITQEESLIWMSKKKVNINLPVIRGVGPQYINLNDPAFLLEKNGVTVLDEIAGPLTTSVELKKLASTIGSDIPIGRLATEIGLRTLGRALGDSAIPASHLIGIPLTLAPSMVRNWQNGSKPSRWIADIAIDFVGYWVSEFAGIITGSILGGESGGAFALPAKIGADVAVSIWWDINVGAEANRDWFASKIKEVSGMIWKGLVYNFQTPAAATPPVPPIPNPTPSVSPLGSETPEPITATEMPIPNNIMPIEVQTSPPIQPTETPRP